MSPAIDTKRGRFYPWKDGKYVSVTTAIGEGVPKPGLNKWFVRNMAETAAIHRLALAQMEEHEAKQWLMDYRSPTDGYAANLGSSVHSIVEKISKGERHREPTEEETPFIKSFMAFLKKRSPKIIETEATVYSHTHGYAGTMDGMMEIDGRVYVVDIKTGKSVWPEAALQIAAYRHADFIGRPDGTEDAVPPSDGGLVLHLRPNGHRIYPVDTGPEVYDTFLSALDIFRWINIDSESVIGEKW